MVTIEPIAMKHAAAVQRLASHPDIIAMTLMPDPYPEDGAAEWIRFILSQPDPAPERPYAILDRDELVGVCGFKDVTPDQKRAEYGYWIGRPYWNRGYASAAGTLALELAFRTWGTNYIFATPLERNKASCRVLEKLGFRFVKTMENPFAKWRPDDRMAYYEMTASDYGV